MFSFLLGIFTIFSKAKSVMVNRSKKLLLQRQKIERHLKGHNSDELGEGENTNEPKTVRTKVLSFLTAIFIFFETLPIFFNLLLWGVIILCVVVLVVIIFAFISALMAQDRLTPPENACAPPDGVTEGEGGSYVSAGGLLAWTDAELASKGATLTDKEKNLYRLGILSRKAIEGYTGAPLMNAPGATLDMKIAFLMGVASTETSMRFYTGKEQNIMVTPSTIAANSKGFGFMGIRRIWTLTTYFGTKQSAVRNAYTPSPRPPYDSAFAPYGVAMSAMHHERDLKTYINTAKTNARLEKVASAWGIKANKAEYISITKFLLAQAEYHGSNETDDFDALMNFSAALLAATSDNDAERTYSRWTLEVPSDLSKVDYSESGIRKTFMGSGGKNGLHKGGGASSLTGVGNTKVLLNGTPLTKPVWAYLGAKFGSNAGFQVAWKNATGYSSLNRGGAGDRTLNFHYGFNSYLQGRRVESILAKKMNILGPAPVAPATGETTQPPATGTTPPATETVPPATGTTPPATGTTPTAPATGEPKQVTDPTSLTVLVNKKNLLPNTYAPSPLAQPNVTFSFGKSTEEKSKMRQDAAKGLEELFTAAKAAKIELAAVSGYRSYKRQEELYKAKVKEVGEEKAKTIVAPPGTSEHQTGLVMDISSKSNNFNLDEKFANTTEGKWLAENAHKHGFIMRYPKGKEAVTEYIYEPWHYRFVGKELAAKLFKENKTLDEHFTEVPQLEEAPKPSVDDCGNPVEGDTGDSVGTPVTPGNFKATPGKGQAKINGIDINKWMADYIAKGGRNSSLIKQFMPHWGKSAYLESPNGRARKTGYKDEFFGVPFYGQGKSWGEGYGTIRWAPGGGTMNQSGCMVFSHAYAVSALQGKVVNGAEMASIMLANGALSNAGIHGSNMPSVYKKLGLKSKYIPKGTSNSAWGKPSDGLGKSIAGTVAKGGVAIIRFDGTKYASGSNHYVTIMGTKVKDGQTYYKMYSSTSIPHSEEWQTAEYYKSKGLKLNRDAVIVWK